jgi:hypothetical protein
MALEGTLTAHQRGLLSRLSQQMNTLESELAERTRDIEARIAPWEEMISRLTQIPGIDRISAWTILARNRHRHERLPRFGPSGQLGGLSREPRKRRQANERQDAQRQRVSAAHSLSVLCRTRATAAVCDSLGPEQIDSVFRKWLKRIPLPLRVEDRQAGYDWDLSIWQTEVSLTQIFDRPLRGREFFEEIIDNLDLGRPDRVQLVFDRVVTKKTPGEFKTRVIQDGVHPSLHINYKNFDLKQYLKEGRGCRTEGTFRNPNDLESTRVCPTCRTCRNWVGRFNRHLLEVERVSATTAV